MRSSILHLLVLLTSLFFCSTMSGGVGESFTINDDPTQTISSHCGVETKTGSCDLAGGGESTMRADTDTSAAVTADWSGRPGSGTDNANAFQARLTGTCMLEVPKGLFRLAHGLNVSNCQQVVIRGAGHGVSRLVFDGAVTIGIDVDQTSFRDATDNVTFIIQGVQIATTQSASGTALRLRQVPSVAAARNGYRFYENDVLMSGDTQETQGWAKAETLKDVENGLITSSEFIGQGYDVHGSNQSRMTQSSTALEVLDSGCTVPGPITVVGSNFYAWDKAATFGGCTQGVNFTADNMVSVGYGIYWSGTPGNPDLVFANGHINAFITDIYVRGVPSVNVHHSLFYIDPGSATTNRCMLDIGGSSFGNIDHNEFWAFVSTNRSTTGRPASPRTSGICLQDATSSYSIDSNKFYSDGPVPASGSITFMRNPAAGETLTIGTATVEFVAKTPRGAQVRIGSDVRATLANLFAFLSTSRDGRIARNTYVLVGDDPVGIRTLAIVSKSRGAAGNDYKLATTARATLSSPMLDGGTSPWSFNVAYQIGGSSATAKISINGTLYNGGFNLGYFYDPNKPARPIAYGIHGALLSNVSAIAVPSGADTVATYSGSKFDSDGFRRGKTSIVIPAGTGYRRARVCAGGVFKANAAGYRRLSIAKNGRTNEPGLAVAATIALPDAGSPLDSCTGLIDVAEGDVFVVEWFQNSGGLLDLDNAWISIEVPN